MNESQRPLEEHDQLPAVRTESVGVDRVGYEPEELSPFQRVHRLLRGRYHWAILLGLIGATAGGLAGWFSQEFVYESRSLIQYRPYTPRIIYETEDNRVPPMWGAFLNTQVQLIQSNRAIEMAMQDEDWRRLGRGASANEFRKQLQVNQPRNTNLISIVFEDVDPRAATIAVRAITQSYRALSGERGSSEEQQRLRILEDRRQMLTDQIASLRQRIRTIADEFGSDMLDQQYTQKLDELNRIQSALRETEIALTSAARGPADNDEAAGGVQDPEQFTTPEEVAQVDGRMRELLGNREAIENRLRLLRNRLGDNHRQVRDLLDHLALVEEDIEERFANFSHGHGEGMDMDQTIAQLRTRRDRLTSLRDQAREETLELGRKRLEIESLRDEISIYESRLQQTRNRLEHLNVESSLAERIEVLDEAVTSSTPANFNKRIQMVVAGTGGGGGVGVGLILLLGLIDRRLRHTDEATQIIGHLPLLGVLPRLPGDISDPAEATTVASSLHQVRTLMQLGVPEGRSHVFCMTSSVAGSGKTSLTIALGMSFAASGSRTLLIDADLVSGGLSKRMESIVRRRIGHILRRENMISSEQLTHALKESERTGRKLGETLCDLGILTQQQIDEVLAVQEQTKVGLLDVIQNDSLDECVASTGIEDLSVLPVGGATVEDLSRISPAKLKRAIEQARKQFDVVLVDTGPVPGSMESAAVSTTADGVVFVVARGDRRPRVERSIEFLESIGAQLAGFVFNRADPDDLAISSYSTSSFSQSRDIENELESKRDGTERHRFGPLAGSVVGRETQLPPNGNGNGNGHHRL